MIGKHDLCFIGKISKTFLESAINVVKEKSGLNLLTHNKLSPGLSQLKTKIGTLLSNLMSIVSTLTFQKDY